MTLQCQTQPVPSIQQRCQCYPAGLQRPASNLELLSAALSFFRSAVALGKHKSNVVQTMCCTKAVAGPSNFLNIYGQCRATVRAAKAFGLFVELQGHRRQGLVHSTAISADVSFSKEDDEASRAKALDFLYPPGTEVWVKVTKVDEAQQKFGCSMQVWVLSTSPGPDHGSACLLYVQQQGTGMLPQTPC